MKLIERAEAGDVAGVLGELRTLTVDQRASLAADLEARFGVLEIRDWTKLTDEQKVAISSARLGCQTVPEAAATWLRSGTFMARGGTAWLADVIDLYPAAWQAALVAQLDEQADDETSWSGLFTITDHIVRTTGCPVPTSTAYLNAWLQDRGFRPETQNRYPLDGARGTSRLERLRDDACASTLLPLVVANPRTVISRFIPALVTLAAEGVV
ncbi:hypothetical protein ACFQ07_13330, partial [Actinomadura adrarensis]